MDCWRKCIAHCLAIRPEKVPDFVATAGDEWVEATNSWLQSRGRNLFGLIAVTDRGVGIEHLVMKNPVQVIMVGKVGKTMHAVVKEPGGQVWCPSSGRGLDVVRSAYFIV